MSNKSLKSQKSNFMFDAISGIYSLFYASQKKKFGSALKAAEPFFDITKFSNALDVGCGTGALCDMLSRSGIQMTGIDNSLKMLKIAARKNTGNNTRFLFHDAATPLPFGDGEFDLTIASYVAHGLVPEERIKMLTDMRRVSKHYVILHDYGKKRKLTTDIIESLEGGNYFGFIKNIESQLDSIFIEVKIIPVDKNALWYVCKV